MYLAAVDTATWPGTVLVLGVCLLATILIIGVPASAHEFRKTTLVLSGSSGGRLLGPMGRILRASALSPFVRQRMPVLLAASSGKLLDELTELVDSGKVVPAVERTYPLHEAPEAPRHFAEERARSKIVITVPPA
ncbi:zinc-binding dehydrogenase [Streptosporangium sp. NPDC023615]|uniref:zinc-binding dehydrogenase n=1 Tax=Streptosporangium sp. NPDC023615 TaxID=3154794 RepID=UPI0034474838